MNEKEMKLCLNQRTGRKQYLPYSIYNNPIRMQSRGWVVIEQPADEPNVEPVSVNLPEPVSPKPVTEQDAAPVKQVSKNKPKNK